MFLRRHLVNTEKFKFSAHLPEDFSGSSACIQGVGTSHAVNLSPQFMLGVKYDQTEQRSADGYTFEVRRNPCDGGFALDLITDAGAHCESGSESCWMTCTDVCTSGCLHYTEGHCFGNDEVDLIASTVVDGRTDWFCEGSSNSALDRSACAGCNNFALPTRSTCAAAMDSSTVPLAVPLYDRRINVDRVTIGDITDALETWVDQDRDTDAEWLQYMRSSILQGDATIGRVMAWLKRYGPVSIAIQAGQCGFEDYWSNPDGHYNFQPGAPLTTTWNVLGCNAEPDHAVTIVGWSMIDGQPCWTVQNSWNTYVMYSNTGDRHFPTPDDGFFHVPFRQVGFNGETSDKHSNAFTIATPTGVFFATGHAATRAARSTANRRPSHHRAPGSQRPVTDPSALATLPAHAATLLSQQLGETMTVVRVESVNHQITRHGTYTVKAAFRPVNGGSEQEMEVVIRKRGSNGAPEYIKHRVVSSHAASQSLQSSGSSSNGQSTHSTNSSAGSSVGVAIGVAVVALIVLMIAAFVVSHRREQAQRVPYASIEMTEEVHGSY